MKTTSRWRGRGGGGAGGWGDGDKLSADKNNGE